MSENNDKNMLSSDIDEAKRDIETENAPETEERVETENTPETEERVETENIPETQDDIQKKKKLKTLRIVLLTVIVLCAALLIGMFVRNHTESKPEKAMHSAVKTEKQVKDEPKNENTNPVDFATLHKQNPDIFAWIRIPNTKVDYAICQSTKDKGEDYYLDHGYSQEKQPVGTIYIQMRNKKDFSNPVTVIYGHNVHSTGKMFRTLHNYDNAKFFKDNPEFTIFTEDNRKLTYRIFAAYDYDDRLILDYYNDFKNPNMFKEYLNEIKKYGAKKNYDADNAATKDDKIVTLSTCNEVSDQRFLIQAKLVSDEKMNDFKN